MLGKSGGLRLCFSGFRRPPNKMQPALTAFNNFNSLFDPSATSDSDDTLLTTGDPPSSASTSQTLTLTDDDDDDDEYEAPPPSADLLSTAIAARRLLPAAPGLSNSIFDSPAVDGGGGGGVAVSTFSPDPYRDFRRSMEEMVAALGLVDPRAHRADLYELLLCYLALNRKHAHKYIVGAFADLLRSLADTAAPIGD